jgi:hypothetical protein
VDRNRDNHQGSQMISIVQVPQVPTITIVYSKEGSDYIIRCDPRGWNLLQKLLIDGAIGQNAVIQFTEVK